MSPKIYGLLGGILNVGGEAVFSISMKRHLLMLSEYEHMGGRDYAQGLAPASVAGHLIDKSTEPFSP